MIIKSRIPIIYIVRELKESLFYVTCIAIISSLLPFFFSSFLSDIPISIATTLGVAISILLSYKINQSYERWWEARKIWGDIVNDSRTLILQLQTYLKKGSPEIKPITYNQIAWCYSLGSSLRRLDSMHMIKQWLTENDFKRIKNKKNVPLSILCIQSSIISRLFEKNKLDRFSQIRIEETISRFTASMGKCERIKNTVFPPMYKYGLHATIYLFVIFLSLSVAFRLQNFILGFSILIIVSMVFFFLEKVAYRMQDPFENIPTDTPVTTIAKEIENNLLEVLEQKIHIETKESDKFYVL
jgi:putative membrane protein